MHHCLQIARANYNYRIIPNNGNLKVYMHVSSNSSWRQVVKFYYIINNEKLLREKQCNAGGEGGGVILELLWFSCINFR